MFEKGEGSRRRGRNWDAYAAVIASLVGLLALLVSAYTANLERTQLRAQIWPRVEMGYASNHKILVLSVGLGPARVTRVRVTLDGKPMKDWEAVFRSAGADVGFTQAQFSGRVMPPGSQVEVLATPDTDAGRAFIKELGGKHKVGILACYCSVLDDCWLAGFGDLSGIEIDTEHPVDDCPIDEKQQFAQ